MDILMKTTIVFSITNKYQTVDLFRTDETKGKKSIPRMELFRASGTVEILNLIWPFITWWSKEGQVDWQIKLQKLRDFKDKYNNKFLCWYYMQKKKVYYSSWIFWCQQYLLTSIYSESQTKTKHGSGPVKKN